VHISGHGEAGALVLEDDFGGTRALNGSELRAVFAPLGPQIRCVVLNACATRPQAAAIAEHVPCVIGTSQAISDPAAIAFSRGFYEALAHGEVVKTAFELGCHAVALARRGDRGRDITESPAPERDEAIPSLLGTHDPAQVRFC
jgi:hypothetical protein